MVIIKELFDARIRDFSTEQISIEQDKLNKNRRRQRDFKLSLEAVDALRGGIGEVVGLEFDSVPDSLSLGDMSGRSLLTVINRGQDGRMQLQGVDPSEVRVITIAVRMPGGKG